MHVLVTGRRERLLGRQQLRGKPVLKSDRVVRSHRAKTHRRVCESATGAWEEGGIKQTDTSNTHAATMLKQKCRHTSYHTAKRYTLNTHTHRVGVRVCAVGAASRVAVPGGSEALGSQRAKKRRRGSWLALKADAQTAAAMPRFGRGQGSPGGVSWACGQGGREHSWDGVWAAFRAVVSPSL